jgi:Flp pilus assembly protein TadG
VRNLTDERGAVAVITAILLVAMMGMAAIVVDVGSLYQERRILQNGADAAALAVAQTCAKVTCDTPTAQTYANANNPSTAPAISIPAGAVCGSGPGLTACTNPPRLPSGVQNYVKVTTASTVSYTFARVLGFSQGSVNATSVVAWGGPASLTSTLPLTLSACEFGKYSDADSDGDVFNPNSATWDTDSSTDTVGDLAPPPPYPPYPSSPYQEAVIYFHSTTGLTGCADGPAGADLPGGFGWLQTSTGCSTSSSINNWFNDKTGRPAPATCTPALMAQALNTVVHLPVFSNTNGLSGSNGQYYINNYASFYLTGYSINGQYKQQSVVTGNFPCSGSDSCISGYFINDPTPVQGGVGGPSTGVTAYQLIG